MLTLVYTKSLYFGGCQNENDRKCARPSRQNDMMNYQGLYVIQRTLVSKVCHAVTNYKVGNSSKEYSMGRNRICNKISLSPIFTFYVDYV